MSPPASHTKNNKRNVHRKYMLKINSKTVSIGEAYDISQAKECNGRQFL